MPQAHPLSINFNYLRKLYTDVQAYIEKFPNRTPQPCHSQFRRTWYQPLTRRYTECLGGTSGSGSATSISASIQCTGWREWREARGCKGRKDVREGDGEYKEGRRRAGAGEHKGGECQGGTHHTR